MARREWETTEQRSMRLLRTDMSVLRTDTHAEKIRDYFGQRTSDPEAIGSDLTSVKLVFICFTNRSGSNYLAHLMASTGEINLAGEFFNHETVINRSERRQITSMHAYVADLIRHGRKGDFFAAKASIGQLAFLDSLGILEAFGSNVSYILVERSNKLAQAVSYMIAMQTKRWTSFMKTEVDPSELRFDPDLALGFLDGVIDAHNKFDIFFALKSITPLLISYEALVARPAGVMSGLLADCGLPGAIVNRASVRTKRQADPLNQSFEEQLRQHIARERTQTMLMGA